MNTQVNRTAKWDAPPERAVFASRLRKLREAAGYGSARAFAIAADIDQTRYIRYERAEVEPTLSVLRKICETLRITPNELLVCDCNPERVAPGQSNTA